MPGAVAFPPVYDIDVNNEDDDDDEERPPELHLSIAFFMFVTCNIALFFIIDYVINSVNSPTTKANLSKSFIGLILLPIPNFDLGTVISATKDQMDIVIQFTFGKCLQTSLLVTHFLILLAWWTGLPAVTLAIDGFEIVSLFAAILLLNFVVSRGECAWNQGILLLADWSLIAIAAFFTD
ncbi:hypothetical protein BX600DRAFT_47943 [Xylariales sp. PMI_506]|nr:hypothetical protein BX600DRAFT_47943 [Xylariales sp. PMI_506]